MLPVEMVATVSSPSSRAMKMQASEPRSLKLQVGFWVSFLSSRWSMPASSRRRSPAGISGVFPSPSERSHPSA